MTGVANDIVIIEDAVGPAGGGGEFVYVPENFDAARVLGCDQKRADAANWLVDRLYLHSHFAMRENEAGFVPLKVAYLRQVIPQPFERDLRERLVDAGVIECDHHYVKGQKSMGYRLAPAYRTRHRRVPIRHHLILRNVRRVRAGALLKLSGVHRYLHRQFDRLTVDLSGVKVEDAARAEWFDFSAMAAEQLRNREWTPVVCDYGRFHTPITRMMSECRSGLRLDGHRLVNLDVANSQPLLLGLLFLKVLKKQWSNATTQQEEHELMEIISTSVLPPRGDRGPAYTMGVLINSPSVQPDVQRYVELTQQGRLYDFLANNSSLGRDEFKKALFRDVFFGQNYIDSPLKREFRRLFPNAMRFIARIKRGNYARLAWIMQREESRLVIDGVCGRLMREHPGVPILTIHDSILTTPPHEGTVRDLMGEVFGAAGVAPTIRATHY